MIATTYPLLDFFWTLLYFVMFFILIYLLIVVFSDIFRSHDMGGWAKALWVIFIVVLPYLGILIYLIARGGSMHERAVRQAQQQQEAFRSQVQQAAGSTGAADQLAKLADLKASGAISEEEFERGKAKVLS